MKINKSFLPCFIAFHLLTPFMVYGQASTVYPSTAVSITVQAGARQSFQGFGSSSVNFGEGYNRLTLDQRHRLCQLLYKNLNFKILRLWLNTDQYSPAPGTYDMSDFNSRYVDSGIIADARKNGVTTLLLAPSGLPPYMAEKSSEGSTETGMGLIPAESESYADLLAGVIHTLKLRSGVTIDVTGVENEPNDGMRFTPVEIVRVVKRLRSDLDQQKMESVKIIAPENANVDGSLYAQLDALQADPIAWQDLSGIASHSYGMAASERAASYIAGTSKTYWMTEASDNGPEIPGDSLRAASLACRFLCDMNHRVSYWIHFIGFEQADPRDNATRIIAYTLNPFDVTVFEKYFYYEQLNRAFDHGAVFRASQSSLDGDMTYTYGKKTRLAVASARNPDGDWAIGLCNYTAPTFHNEVTGPDLNTGYAAQTFDATVTIPELADVKKLTFNVYRSNGVLNDIGAGTVVSHNGVVMVKSIQPLELVTLRSGRSR